MSVKKNKFHNYYSYKKIINEIHDKTQAKFIIISILYDTNGYQIPIKYDSELDKKTIINFNKTIIPMCNEENITKITKQKFSNYKQIWSFHNKYCIIIANYETILEDFSCYLSQIESIDMTIKNDLHNRFKSIFVSKLKNNIQTQMTKIISLSENKIVRETAIDVANKISDMVDFHKLEARAINLHKTLFNLREFVLNIIEIMASKCASKKIIISDYIKSDTPEFIYADEKRLRQILVSLILNAIKYSRENGNIAIMVTTTESEVSIGKLIIEFTIEDHGIGIKSDKLFEGLSINICKMLLELMGGKLWLYQSIKNKGTTIKFNMVATEEQFPDYINYKSLKRLNGRYVGILDVNNEYINLLSKFAEKWNLYYITAKTLEAFVLKTKTLHIDMVFNGINQLSKEVFLAHKIKVPIINTTMFPYEMKTPFIVGGLQKNPSNERSFLTIVVETLLNKHPFEEFNILLIDGHTDLKLKLEQLNQSVKYVHNLTEASAELAKDLFIYDIIFVENDIPKFIKIFKDFYDDVDEEPMLVVVGTTYLRELKESGLIYSLIKTPLSLQKISTCLAKID